MTVWLTMILFHCQQYFTTRVSLLIMIVKHIFLRGETEGQELARNGCYSLVKPLIP